MTKDTDTNTPELIPDARTPAYALNWLDQHKRKHGLPPQGARPKYWPTPEAQKFICREIADGKSLRAICSPERARAGTWIRAWTIIDWLARADVAENYPGEPSRAVHSDFQSFRRRYARATTARLELDADRLRDIERRLIDVPQKVQRGNAWGPNPKALDPHAARVAVDSIKWRLAKLAPEKYGERQELKVSGEVKVSRPSQDAPEWMQERLKAKIGKEIADEAAELGTQPAPAKPGTVH